MQFGAFKILGSFDDALADRLSCGGRVGDQHPSGYVSFWNGAGFDDANPGVAGLALEIFSGDTDFFVGGQGFMRDHVPGRLEGGSEHLRKPLR